MIASFSAASALVPARSAATSKIRNFFMLFILPGQVVAVLVGQVVAVLISQEILARLQQLEVLLMEHRKEIDTLNEIIEFQRNNHNFLFPQIKCKCGSYNVLSKYSDETRSVIYKCKKCGEIFTEVDMCGL